MATNPSGISTDTNLRHAAKAKSPIDLQESGITIEVNSGIHNQLLLNNLQVISQKYGRNL